MIKLVIGGGGFLGTRIVEMLIENGEKVRVYGQNKYPHIEKLGCESIKGDICDLEALKSSMKNVDTVFLVAAKAAYWGYIKEFAKTNIEGTKTVLKAMRECNVKKLINTSSPSVVGFDMHLTNVGQDYPIAKKHKSPYPETKAEAEKLVATANSPELYTVSLRPHMIFGPNDKHVVVPLIKKASKGKMIQIGTGKNVVDITYIDNAAGAHIDAANALTSHKAPCAGKSYFISNDEPIVFFDYFNNLIKSQNIEPISKTIPRSVAYYAGHLVSFTYKLLRLKSLPPITPYLANMMAYDHWYDMNPAKQDLGYKIRVSMEEGTKLTKDWLAKEKPWLN